jgi:hypothetical protein
MSAIRFETDLHKLHTLRKVRRGAGSTVPRAPLGVLSFPEGLT